MDGGGTNRLGLDFDAPSHRSDWIYSGSRRRRALTGSETGRNTSTLVNVPLISFVGLHLLDVSLRFLRRLAALLLHNCAQGCINIFRHLQRITANVKIRSGVEPAP